MSSFHSCAPVDAPVGTVSWVRACDRKMPIAFAFKLLRQAKLRRAPGTSCPRHQCQHDLPPIPFDGGVWQALLLGCCLGWVLDSVRLGHSACDLNLAWLQLLRKFTLEFDRQQTIFEVSAADLDVFCQFEASFE